MIGSLALNTITSVLPSSLIPHDVEDRAAFKFYYIELRSLQKFILFDRAFRMSAHIPLKQVLLWLVQLSSRCVTEGGLFAATTLKV